MKRIVLAGAVVFALIVALAVIAVGPDAILSRLTPEGRRARLLRDLERGDLVIRRSCFSSETFVNNGRWSQMSAGDRQAAAEVLASWCAAQGGSSQMTIMDAESRRKLAHWDGTTFQAF